MNARAGSCEISVAERWSQLSSRRLDWAFDAYRRFIDDLSDETRSRLATGGDHGEAYVVVFGRTQVGKTTLLLDLMGVSPQETARVSSVLRGGRDVGKSATATAMEYRRSQDDQWRIEWEGAASFDSDAAMSDALAALRQRMSAGNLTADVPVVVWIPANCFGAADSTAPLVRMLDLPGDNPREQSEQRHVNAMAERYVPNADLILLVGRADDLSFLSAEALTLPHIQDWRIIPERFRIVTTYSFTPDTQRKAIDVHAGELDAGFFRQRLREQIETFGRALPEDQIPSRLFFPLEFGHSWANQARQADKLFARIDPIVSVLKRQLHRDIEESATAYSRLRSAVHVHVTAAHIKTERLASWDMDLERMRGRLRAVETEKQHIQTRLENAEEALKNGVDFDEPEIVAILEQQVADLHEEGTDPFGKVESNRNALSYLISRFSSRLLAVATEFRPLTTDRRADGFWANITPDEEPVSESIQKAIRDEFSFLRKKLSDYAFDEYWPSIWGSEFEKDKGLMLWAMGDATKAMRKLVLQHWKDVATNRMTTVRAMRGATESKATLARHDLEEASGRWRTLQAALQAEESRRDTFSEQMDRDRQMGERFKAYLNEAYLQALRERLNNTREAGASPGALLMLWSAVQLGYERDRILTGQS